MMLPLPLVLDVEHVVLASIVDALPASLVEAATKARALLNAQPVPRSVRMRVDEQPPESIPALDEGPA